MRRVALGVQCAAKKESREALLMGVVVFSTTQECLLVQDGILTLSLQLVPFWSPLALAMGRKESGPQAGFHLPLYSR